MSRFDPGFPQPATPPADPSSVLHPKPRKHYEYRSIGRLTEVNRAVMIACVAAAAIDIILTAGRGLLPSVSSFQRGYPLMPGIAGYAPRLTLGFLQFVINAVRVTLFLTWVHGAYRNALALGGTGLTFTPGRAVGCYFVPVTSLWQPYVAMKEIWRASWWPAEDLGDSFSGSVLVGWWWMLWLLGGLGSLLLSVIAANNTVLASMFPPDSRRVLSELIYITSHLTTIALITRIATMQETRAQGSAVPARQ
jgi:hypothetical protein